MDETMPLLWLGRRPPARRWLSSKIIYGRCRGPAALMHRATTYSKQPVRPIGLLSMSIRRRSGLLIMPRLYLNLKFTRGYRAISARAVLAIGLIVLQPFLWQFVRELVVRFQQDRSQASQLAAVEQHLAAIQQEQQNQLAQFPQLAAVVPEDKSALSLLERLEEVASALGAAVEVRGIVEEAPLAERAEGEALPESPAAGGSVTVFPLAVTVTVQAPPAVLLDYIDAVEHMEELVQVRSVRLSADQAGGGNVSNFGLTMEIIFYLQRHGNVSGS